MGPAALRFVLFAACVAGTVQSACAATARTAEDLCPPDADPCVIDRAFDVAGGSRLDFGTRALVVADRGLLDFGSGDAEVACGRLDVTGPSTGLRVRGAGPDGRSAGGNVAFVVHGRCSGAPWTRCLVDASCASLGAGNCAHDGATATLGAALAGSAALPGRFVLRAAGDIEVHGDVAMSSTIVSTDGGGIEIESTMGSIRVAARLDAAGGSQAAGGRVELIAALDVAVGARIDAGGGEFDGGDVTIVAERDAVLAEDIRVDATGGAGCGGDATVLAARHLQMLGGSATNPVEIAADGHQAADGRGGDGGSVTLQAGGELRVARDARIVASGAPPDGFADQVSLRAGTGVAFDGRVQTRGRGIFGGGGLVLVESDATIALGPDASFDLTGAAGGGDLVLDSGTDLRSEADADVSAGAAGTAGRVIAVAGGEVDLGGTWRTAGADSAFLRGELVAEGCGVHMTGAWTNAAVSGLNRIVVRERGSMSSAATVSATGTLGENRIVHRSTTPAPLLEGAFDPPPVFVPDPSLPGCTACGESGAEGQRGCDDADLCRTALCDAEPCSTIAARRLAVSSITVRALRNRNVGIATWRAAMPSSLLPVEPERANLRLVVADSAWRTLVDATLPAGTLVAGPGSWRFRAGRGEAIGGLRRVTVALHRRSSMARWRVTVQGEGLADATGTESLAVALSFGEATGVSSCVSSATLDCKPGRRALRCRLAAP